jgi:hypothetical protein
VNPLHAIDTSPPSTESDTRASRYALGAVVLAFVVLSVSILRFRVFVTHDSISNYGHVWYISEHLRHAHRLPYHMPVLAHGDALAYPYGFVPWTLTAFARLALGDWSVTLAFVVAFWFMVGSMFRAFPELRRPALGVTALAHPGMVIALIAAQFPFMASMGFLFMAIRAWRQQRHWRAAIAGGLAQLTHPAVVAPIVLAIVAVRYHHGASSRCRRY